jgi:hypothetical protein
MKRCDLIRELTQAGCILHRHEFRHDIYRNPTTREKQPAPRHAEIEDAPPRHIKG